ncbi:MULTISPECIES: DUF3137 domain-containing protein [Hyphobacterium]|uniref:DUF3137 domain-containing protein n=1 Tax=Hyphobacterium vulgare TaxID=1736751 RepID=A0ABV6ZUI2_9PROT
MADAAERLGIDSETLWTERLLPFLEEREGQRRTAVRRVFIFGPLALISLIVLFVGIAAFDSAILMFGMFGLIVVFFYLAAAPMVKLHGEIKEGLLTAIATAAGMTYSKKPVQPARFSEFCELGMLPNHNQRSFEDHFAGDRHGAAFELYEAKLVQKTQSGKNTTYTTVFQGVCIRIEFPRTVEGVTVVTRDAGWFNGLAGLAQARINGRKLERVGLVDPKFEQIFEVFSTDQVMSRYLLTPSFMERLLSLETSLKGKRVRAAFDERNGGGELLIATETGNLFEPGSLFKPLNDRSRFESLITEIDLITEIVDLMVRPATLGEGSAVS